MNDGLSEHCALNGFGLISNENISRTHLWKDGIHLEDLVTNILAGNFVDFLNRLFYPNLVNIHDYIQISI